MDMAAFQPSPYTTAASLTPQSPYRNPRDVYEQWLNERDRAANRGDAWDQQLQDEANYSQSQTRGYDQLVPDLYKDIWAGGGGYTPDMQSQILDQPGLQKLGWDPAMGEQNYLTPDEITASQGNPYAAFDNFQGQQGKVESWMNEGNQNERGAVNRLRSDYDAAIDPAALRMDPNYAGGQRGQLAAGASQIRGVTQDPSLGVSQTYLDQAGMSDDEVRQMAQSRAQQVGGLYRADIGRLESQANAAGITNPLGVSAMRGQRLRESAAAQSDALNRGELDARAAQRAAATGVEDTRLGAEQFRSGMAYDAEGRLLDTGLGIESDIEGRRQAGEQDISNRRMNAAGVVGGADTGVEGRIADRGVSVGEWGADRAAGLIQSGEAAAASRAQGVAQNRQTTSRTNQQDQFTRDAGASDRTSSRYSTIYAPWLRAQEEGRAAATGQQAGFAQRDAGTRADRLAGWNLSQRGTQGATSGYAGWGNAQNQVGFGSNFSRAAGGALGDFVVRGWQPGRG